MADAAPPPRPLSADEREAAFRAGRAPVPPRFIVIAVAVLVVLGLGGVVMEHVFGNPHGVASTGGTTPQPTTTLPVTGARSVIALTRVGATPAPPLSLDDAAGRPWSLARARGQVLILGFVDATCNDICPVLGQELRQALVDLGPQRARVDVTLVNTDPVHTRITGVPAALRLTGLDAFPNVTFLSGTLSQLSRVWNAYGVQVRLDPTTGRSVHNDVLYVLDAHGDVRYRALPSANETTSGVYRLDSATEALAARAIAGAAGSLAG